MAFAASILTGGGLFAADMANAALGLGFGVFFLAMIAGVTMAEVTSTPTATRNVRKPKRVYGP